MSAWPQEEGKWFWFQPKDKSTEPEPYQCFFYDAWRYGNAASEIVDDEAWDYLAPCLTPADHAAAVQAERAACAALAIERGAWAANDLDRGHMVDRFRAEGRMDMAGEIAAAIRARSEGKEGV